MSDFCDVHTNEIAQQRCQKCSRGMCSRCLSVDSAFCPKCNGINILKAERIYAKREIKNIFSFRLVISFIPALIQTFAEDIEPKSSTHTLVLGTIFFALGISLASAYYFIRNIDVFEDIPEIPILKSRFIGYFAIAVSFTGIPILYFFYLIVKYLKKEY